MKPPIHVGFTGSRFGMTEVQKTKLRKILLKLDSTRAIHFHHGTCVGADTEADDIACHLAVRIHMHYPDNKSVQGTSATRDKDVPYPPKPYLKRNKDIVKNTDLLIACPSTETERLRSGTWATVRYARKLEKPYIIINP